MIPEVTYHPVQLIGVAGFRPYAEADLCNCLVSHLSDFWALASHKADQSHLRWEQIISPILS